MLVVLVEVELLDWVLVELLLSHQVNPRDPNMILAPAAKYPRKLLLDFPSMLVFKIVCYMEYLNIKCF